MSTFFSEKFSWKDITLIETGIIGIIFIIIMIIAFFSCIKRHKEQGKTSKMQCNKLWQSPIKWLGKWK